MDIFNLFNYSLNVLILCRIEALLRQFSRELYAQKCINQDPFRNQLFNSCISALIFYIEYIFTGHDGLAAGLSTALAL
jgi:hypothetical protein